MRKRKLVRVALAMWGVAIVVVIAAAVSGSHKANVSDPASTPVAATASCGQDGNLCSSESSNPSDATSYPAVTPAAPQYTVAQQQAITAAKQYLSMGSGFSRAGLIQQLDSSAGDGFSESLARFAVNHVKVNWDQQAAEAAKGYVKMGGFSYSSLVQQLDSSAGDGFTYAQAVYGAKAAGL